MRLRVGLEHATVARASNGWTRDAEAREINLRPSWSTQRDPLQKESRGNVFFKHEDINKQLKFIDAGLIHYLSLHLTVDNKSLKLVVFMGVLP